ncbi:MAG TPA: hypothetical protein VFJ16_17715 [Longimicrobium sp.]|nr:hypothetical protein [Longimicrobium sp.]
MSSTIPTTIPAAQASSLPGPPNADELRVGRIDGARFPQQLLRLCLPGLVLVAISRGNPRVFIPSVLIGFCSIFLAFRLSRIHGDEKCVARVVRGHTILFVLCSAVILLMGQTSDVDAMLTVFLLYLVGFTCVLTARRMTGSVTRAVPAGAATRAVPARTAVAPRATRAAPPAISVTELRSMQQEIVRSRGSLESLPVFDESQSALQQAWKAGDPSRVAPLLEAGNRQTQNSWQRAVAVHNRAVDYTDRAREKLNHLLAQVQQRISVFNLDLDAIERERSKRGYVTFAQAIPPRLTERRIALRNRSFSQGASHAALRIGRAGHPLAGLLAAGAVLAAQYAYSSKILRELKDAEGQLVVDAEAARGDFAMVDSVLATRIIPNFQRMLELITQLEAEFGELRGDVNIDEPEVREKAMRLAFAVIEGRRLVTTMAGD